MTQALLALSFDNLGEAAEIELGAMAPDAPAVGSHRTATEVVPRLLDLLEEKGLRVTFFVEGLNAELYPELLTRIDAAGHEVAFHAWRHEEWGRLSEVQQAESLARGLAAFEEIGLRAAGMRPPGGELGPGGTRVLRDAGLRYCSPSGEAPALADGVAVLPFRWSHVDAACVLPPMAAAREAMTGSSDPVEPGEFAAYLKDEVERLGDRGGFATFILHPFMLDWLGEEKLSEILDAIAAADRSGSVAALLMREAAERAPATSR